MLLDEDPATLIRHTIGNFNIQPDKQSVSRINDSLSTLAQARDLQLREHKSALQRLQRKHQTLSSHHSELISSHTATAHSTRIADLDTKKFRTAKAASDAEIDCEKLTSHLSDLTSHLQSLEIQAADGYPDSPKPLPSSSLNSSVNKPFTPSPTQKEDQAVLLQLHVIRSLGVHEGVSKDGQRTIVVTSEEKGDVGTVEVNPKFKPGFFANFVWSYL